MTPEHALQIDVMKLSKEVIVGPFRLRAFDRSKNFSGRQHMHEANRGIRSGTPDTELVYAGRSINVELKAGANDKSGQQDIEMELLAKAGAYCGVAWSCVDVVEHWRTAGVPLTRMAHVVALDRDLKRESRRKTVAPQRTAKPRTKRDDPAAIRRMMRPGGSADRDPNLLKNRTLV